MSIKRLELLVDREDPTVSDDISTGKHGAFSGSTRKRRFGRYETLFRIAGGGMAEVYAAHITGEGGFRKVVALKRMLPTLAEDDRFVHMFLDEGRVAANISSPNVVQTPDLGRADDDSLYLVMELVVGVPLSQLIKGALAARSYIDFDIGAEILAQAAQGLHDAHEATTPTGDPLSIIHRDVSPQNILIDISGRTRITDFGVARAMQRLTHTQGGEVKGKMAYFAPEQATGSELDRRVDVFALGICAWETFAARRLFKASNPMLILQNVLRAEIPDLRTIRRDMPAELAHAIRKALNRDPDKRYATSGEFAEALRAAIGKRPPTAAIGTYVRKLGGKSLNRLETELKCALEEAELEEKESGPKSPRPMHDTIEDEPPTIVARTQETSPGEAERRQRVPSLAVVLSDSPQAPEKPRLLLSALIAVSVLAAGLVVGVIFFNPQTRTVNSPPQVDKTPTTATVATPPEEVEAELDAAVAIDAASKNEVSIDAPPKAEMKQAADDGKAAAPNKRVRYLKDKDKSRNALLNELSKGDQASEAKSSSAGAKTAADNSDAKKKVAESSTNKDTKVAATGATTAKKSDESSQSTKKKAVNTDTGTSQSESETKRSAKPPKKEDKSPLVGW